MARAYIKNEQRENLKEDLAHEKVKKMPFRKTNIRMGTGYKICHTE
jgi:hypothetical protein